jgi:hypothetical protein
MCTMATSTPKINRFDMHSQEAASAIGAVPGEGSKASPRYSLMIRSRDARHAFRPPTRQRAN